MAVLWCCGSGLAKDEAKTEPQDGQECPSSIALNFVGVNGELVAIMLTNSRRVADAARYTMRQFQWMSRS